MSRFTVATALVALVAVAAHVPVQAARRIDLSGRKLLEELWTADVPTADFPTFGPMPSPSSMDSKPPSYNGLGPCYGYGVYGYGYSGFSGYGYTGYGYNGYYGYHGMCAGAFSPIQG